MPSGMMPRLTPGLPSVMRPGQFGPMMRTPFLSASSTKYAESATGMPSVMTTMSSMPASTASTTADLANFGGTNTTLALAPVASRASPQVANTGMSASAPFLAPGKVTDVPALRGFTPPTILVPALSMRAVWVMP